jgi:ABC-2 type transport system ATP-binding protein
LKGFFDCRQAAYQWLKRLDAASWAGQRVETLSKGMAQKVQFIAAVIAHPRLVILDEPFAGLDPVNLEILQEAVRSLRNDGTTVIFSTHDMNTAERMCDTILMIYLGRKVLDGSLREIQQRYPVSSVRLRLAGDADLPPGVPGLETATRIGGVHVVSVAEGQQQSLLQRLAACCDIEHFEVVRPSLHDIFVGIARPQEQKREIA